MQLLIVGYGWLGQALAEAALAQQCDVIATNRSGEFPDAVSTTTSNATHTSVTQHKPVQLFQWQLGEQHVGGVIPQLWFDRDVVITLPPGLRSGGGQYHIPNIATIIASAQAHQARSIVLISSTSVYPECAGVVVEDGAAPHNAAAEVLWQAEQLVLHSSLPHRVLRLGGLFGPKRQPGRFTAGKELSSAANDPVNMTHQVDAVQAILLCVQHLTQGERIYNVVSPDHPSKAAFYQQACQHLGLTPPTFTGVAGHAKCVDGNAIARDLGLVYFAQNLLDCLD